MLLLVLPRAADAATAAALTHVDISLCVDLAAPAERLACYDAAAEQARGEKKLAAQPIPSPAVPPRVVEPAVERWIALHGGTCC